MLTDAQWTMLERGCHIKREYCPVLVKEEFSFLGESVA
jgi:hypothetical protein